MLCACNTYSTHVCLIEVMRRSESLHVNSAKHTFMVTAYWFAAMFKVKNILVVLGKVLFKVFLQ